LRLAEVCGNMTAGIRYLFGINIADTDKNQIRNWSANPKIILRIAGARCPNNIGSGNCFATAAANYAIRRVLSAESAACSDNIKIAAHGKPAARVAKDIKG